jgi:putative flippase GtrA
MINRLASFSRQPITDKLKGESRRFALYVVIGLITALLMYCLWGVFFWASQRLFPRLEEDLLFSGSQFLASGLVIFLSYYFNNRFTFADKQTRHAKTFSVLNFYLLYGFSTTVSSVFTYALQNTIPNLNLEIVKLAGISVIVLINYSGQRLWLYRWK